MLRARIGAASRSAGDASMSPVTPTREPHRRIHAPPLDRDIVSPRTISRRKAVEMTKDDADRAEELEEEAEAAEPTETLERPDVPEADALEQAEPLVPPPPKLEEPIEPEAPEADVLEQRLPAYSEDDDDRNR
jgi:hypothetical protein